MVKIGFHKKITEIWIRKNLPDIQILNKIFVKFHRNLHRKQDTSFCLKIEFLSLQSAMPVSNEDIDDIEDLVAAGDLKPSDRYYNKKDVIVRSRKNNSNGSATASEKPANNGACESVSLHQQLLHHLLITAYNFSSFPARKQFTSKLGDVRTTTAIQNTWQVNLFNTDTA